MTDQSDFCTYLNKYRFFSSSSSFFVCFYNRHLNVYNVMVSCNAFFLYLSILVVVFVEKGRWWLGAVREEGGRTVLVMVTWSHLILCKTNASDFPKFTLLHIALTYIIYKCLISSPLNAVFGILASLKV